MTLTFDELINVKDAFSKVVVSPTSKSTPRVSSQGRRVTIEFDSLAPNTTYTVDFADAIEDNNEGNQLQGFTYSFSTGPELDSLRISGRVFSARNLEPQQSMIVGVHSNLADSAFSTTRLLRVAKTDDRGQFTIRGLAPAATACSLSATTTTTIHIPRPRRIWLSTTSWWNRPRARPWPSTRSTTR